MIFTLDGTAWSEKKLLKQMEDDNFYFGSEGKLYLSSSSIKGLSRNPNKYVSLLSEESKEPQKQNTAFDFGSLFHWYILEPHVYEKQVFLDIDKRVGKEWKAAVEEHGRVFLKKDKDKVEELAENFMSCSRISDLLKNSTPEVAAVGDIDGVCFRAKADILGDDFIVDLKTTANLKWFKHDARKFGYAAQVYIYCQLFGIDYKNWAFIAIDKTTGDFGFYTISKEFYLSGKEIVDKGIANYKEIIGGKTKFEPYYIEDVI